MISDTSFFFISTYSVHFFFFEISLNLSDLGPNRVLAARVCSARKASFVLLLTPPLTRLFRCVRSSTPRAPPSPQLLGFRSTQHLPWIHWTVFFTPVNQMLRSPHQCLQQEQAITFWRYRFTFTISIHDTVVSQGTWMNQFRYCLNSNNPIFLNKGNNVHMLLLLQM